MLYQKLALSLGICLVLTACGNQPTNTSTQPTSASTTAPTTTQTTASTSNQATPVADNDTKLQQTLAENLSKSGIQAKIMSVTPTSVPNMFWVKAEGLPAFFTDSTGQYIFQGDVLKVGNEKPEHISAQLLSKETKTVLAGLDKKDMAIFPAKGTTKGVIYAFTDADCGYCRKLHSEINQINSLGIEVRYLPWPRSEQTLSVMQNIWCSSDRNKALTEAKQGMPVSAPNCENPVHRMHELGLGIGVSGTPAIFTENGEQVGGYLPPEQLAKALKIS